MTWLPRGDGHTVIAAPAPGPQQWAGAPSTALDADGSVVMAYRVREGGRDHNVIARSPDGLVFTTVATFTGEAMVERPALVRTERGWRMYASCSTPDSKHWWVGLLEAPTPEELPAAPLRPIFTGDADTAVKDPVIRVHNGQWRAWLCCHLLDTPGAEDRMVAAHATSPDGLDWTWHGTVLTGRPGHWDARGTRITTVLPDGTLAYDGRATAEENWFERTALADHSRSDPVDVRYLDLLAMPDGTHHLYYEARNPDGSHELRVERRTLCG